VISEPEPAPAPDLDAHATSFTADGRPMNEFVHKRLDVYQAA
jgi:hypothetical protein